ncbi:MAG: hypothetical protein KAS72_03750 [Phycisphaerales bacterium]|nr:hypothetical protein [Phycisphaerales bacterium]
MTSSRHITPRAFKAAAGLAIASLTIAAFGPAPALAQDFFVTAPYTSPDNPYYSTCGAGDDCWLPDMDSAEDHEYEVAIPYDGYWRFSLCEGPTFDTIMALGSTLCSDDLAFDDDDGCPGGMGLSAFNVYLTAADSPYYLTVEGYSVEDCGEYQLVIEEGPEPLGCPENSVFSQPPVTEQYDWYAVTSDVDAYGYGVKHFDNFSMEGHTCAVRFWGFMLTDMWWVCDENPVTFEIAFYQNGAGGEPDTQVCTGIYTVTGEDTGYVYQGDEPMSLLQFDVDLGFCCPLQEGWISIQAQTGTDPDCWFNWMESWEGMDGQSYVRDGSPWEGFVYGDYSLCLIPFAPIPCVGDLDGDGDTDQSDLGILLAAYELTAAGDLDGDGDTDQSDLGILLADYGCVP